MTQNHSKNGFDYTCDRYKYINGSWVVYWRFKPALSDIWVNFSLSFDRKSRVLIEDFLDNPQVALEFYERRLNWLSNVPEAQERLNEAQREFGRLILLNADSELLDRAKDELELAELYLKSATALHSKINNKP